MRTLFGFPLDRILEDISVGPRNSWAPPLDVEETPELYAFHVEIPGVDPAEVDITIEDEYLTLRGEKKIEDKNWRRVERRRGPFERVVPLPGAVDVSKVEAQASNGVLVITLPKREEARTHRVKVDVKA